MDSTTEGILIAGHCLLVSLMTSMEAKGLFTSPESAHVYDMASLALAEILPSAMSPEARIAADGYLERLAKQHPQPPD